MEELDQEDATMAYGARFRRVITLSELAENYENWKQMQREEAKRIKASSEARKYILKNITKQDPLKLLEVACNCIEDLTSDRYFGKVIREQISHIRSGDI